MVECGIGLNVQVQRAWLAPGRAISLMNRLTNRAGRQQEVDIWNRCRNAWWRLAFRHRCVDRNKQGILKRYTAI
jgi:hypothetical protein